MTFLRCYSCMKEIEAPGAVCPSCGYDNTEGPAAQEGHALPCGTLLHGKYVIGKMLGQGGFGVTYIGWDLALETPICVKEYFPNGAAMRDSSRSTAVYWSSGANAHELHQGQESFLKEARKAAKLRDLPSVVTVWDVFQENNTAYLVMEYVEGTTLNDYLRRTGKPLGESACIELLAPVMRDLEEVHKRGIVHRDISPDNLMLQKNGKLKLLDLGAAKDLSRGTGQSSFVVAKRGFSPIEQYTQSSPIGPYTDVYAMCATIVYCVTGRRLPEAMERVMGQPIDLSAFSPAVAEILEKGLAIKPEDRIQTMGELLTALEEASANPTKRLKKKPEVQPQKPAKPADTPKQEDTPKKKSKWPALIAALLLIALAGVFFLPRVTNGNPAVTEPPETTPPAVETAAPTSVTEIAKPAPEPTPEPTPKPASGRQTATGKGQGIDGDVVVEVTADENKIYEVKVTQQNETPGIGSVAVEKLPGRIVEANSVEVDGISGATVTSAAIKAAVKDALASMGFDPAKYGQNAAAPKGAISTAKPSETPAKAAAAASKIKIGMVTDIGGVNDKAFNQTSWEGLQALAAEDSRFEVNYRESRTDADYQTNINAFIDEGYDLIISVGYMLADATKAAAEANPGQKFAIIDDESIELPNVACLVFSQEQASYLVGLVAGSMTNSKTVGYVQGMVSPAMNKFGVGFISGVKAACPDAIVLQYNANNFADYTGGFAVAKDMITKGADVIYQAAGGTGMGVIAACSEEGIWAIGVDIDQSILAPKHVITSAVKRVDAACQDISKAVADGKFTAGTHLYDLSKGGVDLAPTRDYIPEYVLKIVEQAKADIIAGKLTVPALAGEVPEFTLDG